MIDISALTPDAQSRVAFIAMKTIFEIANNETKDPRQSAADVWRDILAIMVEE